MHARPASNGSPPRSRRPKILHAARRFRDGADGPRTMARARRHLAAGEPVVRFARELGVSHPDRGPSAVSDQEERRRSESGSRSAPRLGVKVSTRAEARGDLRA